MSQEDERTTTLAELFDHEPDDGAAAEDDEARAVPLHFDARTSDYFRLWIVNLCLTLLTLGIFSAWAKVRKKRFLYAHTSLDGTPFEYRGRPLPILRGRLVAAAVLLVWFTAGKLAPVLLPALLVVGAIALPWIIVRTASFNARSTAYRHLTLEFQAGYWEATKMLLGGVLITVITLGFGFPVFRQRLARFLVQHTRYGGIRGVFFATSKPFLKAYVVAFTLTLALAFVIFFLVFFVLGMASSSDPETDSLLVLVPIYVIYVVGFFYAQTRMRNVIWNHTEVGPLFFQSNLRVREVLWLYLTNAVAIVASLGLLVPWAEVRMLRYRASRLSVLLDGSWDEFRGTPAQAPSAVGAEIADVFALDFSL